MRPDSLIAARTITKANFNELSIWVNIPNQYFEDFDGRKTR